MNTLLADLDLSSVDITGGTINGTTIGLTTPAAGTFTSLTATTATVGTLTATSGTVGGSAIATLSASQTLLNKTLTSPAINGGTIATAVINSSTIGLTTPAAAAFTTAAMTTLTASSTITFSALNSVGVLTTNGSGVVATNATLPATHLPAFTGDVSTSAGSTVTTIGATKVTNAMLAGSITASNLVGTDIATLGTITTGTWNATAITAVKGGTGQTVYAVGDLLQANTTTTLARLAAVGTGNVLLSGGVGTISSWGQVGLTTHVTGTLGAANGGTGLATITAGRLMVGNGTSAVSLLAPGTNGDVLTVSGGAWVSTAPVVLTAATQADQETSTSTSVYVSPGRQQFHPSAAKAWIIFNGTSAGPITPLAQYGISGNVTKNATGDYTVTFATNFSSANYAANGMGADTGGGNPGSVSLDNANLPTASTCRFNVRNDAGTKIDVNRVSVTFYGDQ